MKTKFKTFRPVYGSVYGAVVKAADEVLNEWLAQTPGIEILSWQALPAKDPTDLEFYIIVQYKET
jgi:hypothetical protein